jgi:hypothetical protein
LLLSSASLSHEKRRYGHIFPDATELPKKGRYGHDFPEATHKEKKTGAHERGRQGDAKDDADTVGVVARLEMSRGKLEEQHF